MRLVSLVTDDDRDAHHVMVVHWKLARVHELFVVAGCTGACCECGGSFFLLGKKVALSRELVLAVCCPLRLDYNCVLPPHKVCKAFHAKGGGADEGLSQSHLSSSLAAAAAAVIPDPCMYCVVLLLLLGRNYAAELR